MLNNVNDSMLSLVCANLMALIKARVVQNIFTVRKNPWRLTNAQILLLTFYCIELDMSQGLNIHTNAVGLDRIRACSNSRAYLIWHIVALPIIIEQFRSRKMFLSQLVIFSMFQKKMLGSVHFLFYTLWSQLTFSHSKSEAYKVLCIPV